VILKEVYRSVGVYTGRILKAEQPPICRWCSRRKFEFVINPMTAKTLSLNIPDKLIALAAKARPRRARKGRSSPIVLVRKKFTQFGKKTSVGGFSVGDVIGLAAADL
jgi:hypothetical protein